MRGLLSRQRAAVRAQPHGFVLNGIAYHEPADQIYVTGKKWNEAYIVTVKPQPQLSMSHVHTHCSLGNPSGKRG